VTRPADTPRERVLQLVTAARRLLDEQDPIGRRAREVLPRATGLSREGVELALSRSLEVMPTDEEVEALVASVPSTSRAHVLLSSNVFVGAHRAIALALASAAQVEVRASRREPEMAALLHEASGGLFRRVEELAPLPGDHVWAYGRDETLEALRGDLPSGVVLHSHGSGLGVAVLGEAAEDIAAEARELALDVVVFDQRGCLSPRVVLVEGSAERARGFATELARELARLEGSVPLGVMSADERADLIRYRDTLLYVAEVFPAGRGYVGLDVELQRVYLPPVGRNVHVLRVDTFEPLLEPLRTAISAVGVAGDALLSARAAACLPEARVSAFGRMQAPAFDGAVDRRPRAEGEAL
jgi:hypothetical protein